MKFRTIPAVRARGFTLIEVMIVVVIVGILATVAFPSYRQYIVRGNRAAAESEMMDIANREQQYLLSNRSYTATGSDLGYTLSSDVGKFYTYSIAVGTGTVPSFSITFVPISSSMQANDGNLVLTSDGTKTRAGDPAKW